MYRKKGQLNIAMLGYKRILSRGGGIEIVVEELSTQMVKLKNNTTCYNRKGHHVSGKGVDARNIGKQKEYKGVKIKEVFNIDKKGLAAMTSLVFVSIYARHLDITMWHTIMQKILVPCCGCKNSLVNVTLPLYMGCSDNRDTTLEME